MLATELMLDALGRNAELYPEVLKGLSAEQVLWRPDAEANSIGWLLWHAARVEDDHIAGLVNGEQLWDDGWRERFGLPYDPKAHGYGMSSDDVDRFDVGDANLIAGYYAAVHERSVEVVQGLQESDFERIVDRNWDPPVTLAVRLVSLINDVTQHVGQAAYVRGLVERRG